jgi:PAS domain S-box-containing protein
MNHGRHLFARTLPITDADDSVIAGMIVVQDVTERREAKREFRESEAKFRMIAESLEEIVWMASPDGEEFLYINPAFEDVWGIDRENLYDDPLSFLELVHPEDRERVEQRFAALPEQDFDEEYRIVRPDGEVRWVHARGTSVHDAGNDMTRIVGIGKDITERVERERELERALDLLARTERIADVGGWELDADTMEVYWTDQTFELLGVDAAEEPPLEDAMDMYYDEDKPVVERVLQEALDKGEPFDTEVRLATDRGDVIWLRLQGAPETVGEEVVAVRGAAQDVTERIERERQLEALIEKLEESNERLERFAYVASHDLQEPLRMISNYLQLLERRYRGELDADAEEFIDFAVDGAERMREMISDLLAYSRLDTEAEPFEPTDTAAVVDNVLDDLGLRIEETDADLRVGDLPTVEADEQQLEMVFQNLVSNAIKYSGEEPPRIEIDAERRDSAWAFSVRDDGIGIDPDHAQDIFEVFNRLHTNEEYPGTGIGLAMCEKVVSRHGGDIRVESQRGEGSTFTFTIPVDATAREPLTGPGQILEEGKR